MMSNKWYRVRRILLAIISLSALVSTAYARTASPNYQMPYYIFVDLTNQIVTVYRTEDESIARQMLCSSGLEDYTPIGDFFMKDGRRSSERTGRFYEFDQFSSYAKWVSRITGPILFHSLTYDAPRESRMNKTAIRKFGRPASHGCIRLMEDDARFIAENCKQGTFVHIYESGDFNNELRLILREGSYTGEGGLTYNQFMGIPSSEDEYGLHSEGQGVSDVQARLKELGYYTGSTEGIFDGDTLIAVKKFQKKIGVIQTGLVTPELEEIIKSEDAPVSEDLTMQEGSVGVMIGELQKSLTELGLYSGPIDDIFDAEVAQAVRDFQSANGYDADGVASPEIRAAIAYHKNEIVKMLGSMDDLDIQVNREEIQMGTVNTPVQVVVRKKASRGSDDIGRLQSGETVFVGEEDDSWIQISNGKNKGYVKKMYLDIFPRSLLTVEYSRDGQEKKYRMGYTLQEYAGGASSFASFFSDYFISDEFQRMLQKDVEQEAYYATVNTGSSKVALNLRAKADGESEVLATVPNGEVVQVLETDSEWTYAVYGGQNGYLMSQYLNLEDVLAQMESDEEVDVDRDSEPLYALVAASNGSAPVYDKDSSDATKLGSLKNKTKVQVIKASESSGWVLISLQDHQGYMRDEDLKFLLVE